jgi:hypothetical protein
MESVFRDSEGVIHADFIPNGITINAGYYSNLLRNDLHQAIPKKRSGKSSKKIILLHSNEYLTEETLATMAWEIMKHSLYIPHLGRRHFHLFGPMRVYLGGEKFQTDYEHAVS